MKILSVGRLIITETSFPLVQYCCSQDFCVSLEIKVNLGKLSKRAYRVCFFTDKNWDIKLNPGHGVCLAVSSFLWHHSHLFESYGFLFERLKSPSELQPTFLCWKEEEEEEKRNLIWEGIVHIKQGCFVKKAISIY